MTRTTSLAVRIIPCLDCRGGRVVKGIRFSNLFDAGDPGELARRYEEEGADEVTLLDISATLEERKTRLETVREVRRALSIPLTVGGGVRSVQDVEDLLAAGADKVSLNTAAVERPELISEVASRFGSQCTVLAIDASRQSGLQWSVFVRSGTGLVPNLDAVAWAAQGVALGAGEILVTSKDRDGTREGYDADLVRAVAEAGNVPVIASGGASDVRHFVEAAESGATGLLAASIFHLGETAIGDLKRALREKGVRVRL